jgi:hypothetical protein
MSGYSEPVTNREIRKMRTLHSDGLNWQQIAEELGRDADTVRRYADDTSYETRRRGSVVVLEDPHGIYSPGAEFSKYDLAAGCFMQTWLPGMRFEITERDGESFTAITKVILVRDDGLVLEAKKGAGSIQWVIPLRF